jgi:hypothetical protein
MLVSLLDAVEKERETAAIAEEVKDAMTKIDRSVFCILER